MNASTSQNALKAEVPVTIERWQSTETLAAQMTTPTLAKLVAPAQPSVYRGNGDLFTLYLKARLFDEGVTLVRLRWRREDH